MQINRPFSLCPAAMECPDHGLCAVIIIVFKNENVKVKVKYGFVYLLQSKLLKLGIKIRG
jgi:hypothetical protein